LSSSSETPEDFDSIMQNYSDITSDNQEKLLDEEESKSHISASQTSDSQRHQSNVFKEKISSHFTVIVPKTEISFVSKRQGTYSKYFMLLYVQDLFYQNVTTNADYQKLFYVRNIEVIDKLADK